MTNNATPHDTETEYEKNQRFNLLVSYLHSFRYRNILTLFKSVTGDAKGKPINVVDIGCAHAKLFSILNERFDINYTGIEIDSGFVETARSRYAHNLNFRVIHDSAANALQNLKHVDIVVALETFEHIPEHDVVRIVEAVAVMKPRLFVCSVPVEIGPAIWLKNIGSLICGYMRHTEYGWRETFWAGLYQLDKLPPHDTGHKGFDWRWLAQTIRHNMKIIEIRKFPLAILPTAFSFSVFMIAEPRQPVLVS
ncbi:MAG: class I SAM-dependent methyltransferase [Sterolibacteriaceae bacterium MAG5]|nr:class I SAM-dependent methyltransferase [Candidatus Nitricoxidireducens bremensis]